MLFCLPDQEAVRSLRCNKGQRNVPSPLTVGAPDGQRQHANRCHSAPERIFVCIARATGARAVIVLLCMILLSDVHQNRDAAAVRQCSLLDVQAQTSMFNDQM